MAVRIEVHGKERAKIKYAVEFRCSSCGCEFWVDADSLGEFKPANYCDLKYNCPECALVLIRLILWRTAVSLVSTSGNLCFGRLSNLRFIGIAEFAIKKNNMQKQAYFQECMF